MLKSKNKYFKIDLKASNDGEALMFKGRLFHSFGATTEKARSPFVLQRERDR